MSNNELLTFPTLFGKAVERYGDQNALSFVDEKPLTYKEVYKRVNSPTGFIENPDIAPGQ